MLNMEIWKMNISNIEQAQGVQCCQTYRRRFQEFLKT
jgi:hypothetical protein